MKILFTYDCVCLNNKHLLPQVYKKWSIGMPMIIIPIYTLLYPYIFHDLKRPLFSHLHFKIFENSSNSALHKATLASKIINFVINIFSQWVVIQCRSLLSLGSCLKLINFEALRIGKSRNRSFKNKSTLKHQKLRSQEMVHLYLFIITYTYSPISFSGHCFHLLRWIKLIK